MVISCEIVSLVLYPIVGVVSLVMAFKNFYGENFISFHEQAAGKPLEELDQDIQNVILALMRTTGLGFFVVSSLLLCLPLIIYLRTDKLIELGIPLICGIYCFGLFFVNYQLHRQSGTKTPWKGSLIAVAIIAVAMTFSVL